MKDIKNRVVALGDTYSDVCSCGKRAEWGIATQSGPDGCVEAIKLGKIYCKECLPMNKDIIDEFNEWEAGANEFGFHPAQTVLFKIAKRLAEELQAERDKPLEAIINVHMAGQADAGVDPSYSNAQAYLIPPKKMSEEKREAELWLVKDIDGEIVTLKADNWTISNDGLTFSLDGEKVAHFIRWANYRKLKRSINHKNLQIEHNSLKSALQKAIDAADSWYYFGNGPGIAPNLDKERELARKE